MNRLTKRQAEIFDLICTHIENNGSPPTRAEIARIMGFKSPNAAEDHLKALARKGKINLIPGTSRGIRVTKKSNKIPVVELSSESKQIFSEQQVKKEIYVNPKQFSIEPSFILISPKDYPEHSITKGDSLVCSNQATSKSSIYLSIVNNELKITDKKENFEAVCIGVIRKY